MFDVRFRDADFGLRCSSWSVPRSPLSIREWRRDDVQDHNVPLGGGDHGVAASHGAAYVNRLFKGQGARETCYIYTIYSCCGSDSCNRMRCPPWFVCFVGCLTSTRLIFVLLKAIGQMNALYCRHGYSECLLPLGFCFGSVDDAVVSTVHARSN